MHAISNYCSNRPTNEQTPPQTHRHDRLQYTALQLACSVTTFARFWWKPLSLKGFPGDACVGPVITVGNHGKISWLN